MVEEKKETEKKRWNIVIEISSHRTQGDIRGCLQGIARDIEEYADFDVLDYYEEEVRE